jgi:hypothetical protein
VSFLHEMLFKRIFFYRSCRGGISFFLAKKGNKNASGLSYATLPTAQFTNSANTGLAHQKWCADEINAFTTL